MKSSVTCYHVIYDETNKQLLPKHHFCKRVGSIDSSKESETVPSISGLNETASCPLSPTADAPSALPPLVSNTSCLFTWCQLLYCTNVLFKVLYCKIKNGLFFCLLMYYLCEKYCKPVTVKYYIANFVGLMNKLDLQTCSQKGTHLYVGYLL